MSFFIASVTAVCFCLFLNQIRAVKVLLCAVILPELVFLQCVIFMVGLLMYQLLECQADESIACFRPVSSSMYVCVLVGVSSGSMNSK